MYPLETRVRTRSKEGHARQHQPSRLLPAGAITAHKPLVVVRNLHCRPDVRARGVGKDGKPALPTAALPLNTDVPAKHGLSDAVAMQDVWAYWICEALMPLCMRSCLAYAPSSAPDGSKLAITWRRHSDAMTAPYHINNHARPYPSLIPSTPITRISIKHAPCCSCGGLARHGQAGVRQRWCCQDAL
jgi:hypothetical protein